MDLITAPSKGTLVTILEFQNPHTTGGGRQQPPMETRAAAMVMLENSTPAIAGSQEDFLAVIQLLKDLILDPMSGNVPKYLIIYNLPNPDM